ncbi:uncharacterized protein BX663DRAFT_553532 [Cokeromyces recurvatus]|uniref:uncharacterized protein n=1 Tax=Cokeromyces recurvatus TaxID=90255 RepID=UPI00221E462E|nr:uncharacterized protein BX663DRAFT_553532 [Cokeromyces recurvatus]KAI7900893.1 hypothetical protein BX663DRAFT_553532 [Cokeromyces recurvatus]
MAKQYGTSVRNNMSSNFESRTICYFLSIFSNDKHKLSCDKELTVAQRKSLENQFIVKKAIALCYVFKNLKNIEGISKLNRKLNNLHQDDLNKAKAFINDTQKEIHDKRFNPANTIAFGDAKFGSSMKGKLPAPTRRITDAIKKMSKELKGNTFIYYKLHAVLKCNSCNTVWNRDVMAAKNMNYIFTYMLQHKNERPPDFQKFS